MSDHFFDDHEISYAVAARLDGLHERLVTVEQRTNSLYIAMSAYAEIAHAGTTRAGEQAAADLQRECQRLTGLVDNLNRRLLMLEQPTATDRR